jgi:hypothetical protein
MPIRNKLHSFTDAEAKLVPKEAGAYELLYKDTVVYIGSSSTSIFQRINSHRKIKRFGKVTHFRYKLVEWSSDAIKLEADLCRKFKKANGSRPRLQMRTPTNQSIFDW